MSKEEAKNLFKNPDLMEKVECSKIKNESKITKTF